MRQRALVLTFCAAFALSVSTACSDDEEGDGGTGGTGGKGATGGTSGTGGKGGTSGTGGTGGKGGTGGTGGSTGGTGGSTGGTGGTTATGGTTGGAGEAGAGGISGAAGAAGAAGAGGAAGAAGAPGTAALVRINEIESNGSATDWVEILNVGGQSIDITGWGILDGDTTHTTYRFPSGTILDPGEYIVVDDVALTWSLGAADSVTLFDCDAADATCDASDPTVDTHSWTAHASVSYGRCPNGTGSFTDTTSLTQGAANACP